MATRTTTIRLSAEEFELLDAFRRAHANPPGRAVVLQCLIRDALNKFKNNNIVAQARSLPSLPPLREATVSP